MVPSETLASLTLLRASPAQVLEARKRMWLHWGGMLTEEQYLDHLSQMDTMKHTIDSRLITWVLAPRNNPETLDFVCSCETYKRRGLLRYPGSKEVQEVPCYGIASVFTLPHDRGKGYASHMMRLLHWVVSGRTQEYNLPQFPVQWGAPPPEVVEAGDGMFSFLYSGVGNAFYRRAGPGIDNAGGWETREPITTVWKIPLEAEVGRDSADSKWRWLRYNDLDSFWEKEARLIRYTVENMPESSPDYHTERPKAFISYLPNGGIGVSRVFRSMSTNAARIPSMDAWGVEKETMDTDSDQPPCYATWVIGSPPLPPALVVTRISATVSEFPSLLRHVQDAARKSGIDKMEIWNNIPKHLLEIAAETGGQTSGRKEILSAIKWYGRGMGTVEIEWDEKFCWC